MQPGTCAASRDRTESYHWLNAASSSGAMVALTTKRAGRAMGPIPPPRLADPPVMGNRLARRHFFPARCGGGARCQRADSERRPRPRHAAPAAQNSRESRGRSMASNLQALSEAAITPKEKCRSENAPRLRRPRFPGPHRLDLLDPAARRADARLEPGAGR